MTRREYAGGAAATTLAASITASDLTISLASGGGSDWPTGTSDPFIIAIDKGTGDEEKILVLSRTGDTLTVAAPGNRGFDDTTATSHSVGAAVDHVLGAIDIDEPNAHINNTVLDHHTQYLTSDRHLAISHTTAMYAADSVDNAALGPDAVSDAELQDDAVGSEHIQTDAVGADEIGAAVITEPKYAAGSVSLRAMGADSVDGDKIADDSIDSEHYVNFSVDQDHLSDNAKVHPGMMVVWSGTTEPSSWFFCYGQEKSRIAQANLFAVIGTTYGVGDGSTTFNLPDMRGRMALGLDNMGGTSANRVTAAAADTLGGTDGDETKTIAEANLPVHTHSDGSLATDTEAAHTHGKPAGATSGYAVDVGTSSLFVDTSGTDKVSFTADTGSAGAHSHDVTGATGSTGSGTALDAMNPYMALNWLIKS